MTRRIDRARTGLLTVVRELRREDVTFMAASIAYHAFVSMLPILLLLVLVVSAFGTERVDPTVLEMLRAVLPASGRGLVTDALRNATASVSVSVVGIGVLVWGTAKVFRAMDAAFAEIYDTERKLSLLDQLRDAIVVLFALGVAAVGMVALGTVLEVPDSVPFASVLGGLLTVFGLAFAFLPIYYVFPDVDVSVAEVLPGVLVAAVGWVALKWVFGLYVAVSSKPDVFGLAGTLVLLVTWLYVGGLVLLVGAAVNATLAGRNGDRPTGRRGKRRFGRQVTDVASFERRLDDLVDRARESAVPEAEIRRALRRRAGAAGDVGTGGTDRSDTVAAPDGGSPGD